MEAYVESGKALQQKYDEIRRGIVTQRSLLQEHYKPILEPLREINANLKPLRSSFKREQPFEESVPFKKLKKEELKTVGRNAFKYLGLSSAQKFKIDHKFGLYPKGDHLFLGNIPIVIQEDDFYLPTGEKYEGTNGLWQLMTLENPDPKVFTQEDLDNYEQLVLKSFTYRRNNNPQSKYPKSSVGWKYNNIIKPIITRNRLNKEDVSLAEELEQATGSGFRKILTNNPVEYVYWNDLHELLDRLYIVYGEIKSGNKNPTLYNELVNILQEIKEET